MNQDAIFEKIEIVILSFHTVFSEQNKTHLLIFVTLLVFCRQIAIYSFCLALKDFEREPCQFFRCLTPKLKKKIGQGFVQLLSCSTVLHLRFCLRVCYRGSNYLLGQQHQHWWKGKKWWLNCGKPGGLCKTLFFD